MECSEEGEIGEAGFSDYGLPEFLVQTLTEDL